MAQRYFVNHLQDYIAGQDVRVPQEAIHHQIEALKQRIVGGTRFDRRSCDGGLYVGIAGVAFALTRLLELPTYNDDKPTQQFVDRCFKVSLEYEERHQSREAKPGLLLGSGGVLLAAACYHKFISNSESEVSLCLQSYGALEDICNPSPPSSPDYLNCGSDEILLGRAGFMYGVYILSRKLAVKVIDESAISGICRTMVDVGRQTSHQLSSASPLMYQYHNRQYLGAAHGLSGILQVLLNFPDFVKSDQAVERDIKGSVDYLLSIQRRDGNFAPVADEAHLKVAPGEGLVHWCHGAPVLGGWGCNLVTMITTWMGIQGVQEVEVEGVVYLFAKAYMFWKDEKYLKSCVECADLCWRYGLLKKGPGICHGVAGNGYVFLLMYRLTQEPRYLHRAIKFAEFLEADEFKRNARTPDCPLSLYEGTAGTLCFLIDLLNPAKAEFPLFDVF